MFSTDTITGEEVELLKELLPPYTAMIDVVPRAGITVTSAEPAALKGEFAIVVPPLRKVTEPVGTEVFEDARPAR